jgi:glycine/D-amino acid oxidase-like deaminating enzyme
VSGAPDLVVVGAGVVGMAAALAARDRGARVEVIDDGPPGGAGSAGEGRIFRHIHARPELVRLAVRSRLGWDVWSERFGRRLVDGRGTLLVGAGADEAAARLADAGVAHERLAPDALPAPLAPVGHGCSTPAAGPSTPPGRSRRSPPSWVRRSGAPPSTGCVRSPAAASWPARAPGRARSRPSSGARCRCWCAATCGWRSGSPGRRACRACWNAPAPTPRG